MERYLLVEYFIGPKLLDPGLVWLRERNVFPFPTVAILAYRMKVDDHTPLMSKCKEEYIQHNDNNIIKTQRRAELEDEECCRDELLGFLLSRLSAGGAEDAAAGEYAGDDGLYAGEAGLYAGEVGL